MPMTILSFSGFIPEQICDTVRFICHTGKQSISHYCGYAADFISQVLEDPKIDGAVFPRSCDSSRVMTSYLNNCGKFIHKLHIPARQDAPAAQYLAAEIQRYQQAVEAYYSVTLSDIPERAALVNERNQGLSKLYDELPGLSFSAYLDMLHKLLQTPLREQVVSDTLPPKPGAGKRVYLVGSLLSSSAVAAAIERAGLAVAGDRLTESKRLFSAPPVPADGDVYQNIANSILGNKLSPTQNNFDAILREDLEEIKAKQVRGVLFVTQKFCEPYDYLFTAYQRMLEEQHIPVLRLVMSGSMDERVFEASLEAFADMI